MERLIHPVSPHRLIHMPDHLLTIPAEEPITEEGISNLRQVQPLRLICNGLFEIRCADAEVDMLRGEKVMKAIECDSRFNLFLSALESSEPGRPSLTSIARQGSIHRSRLRQLFRKHLRLSPSDYCLRYRLTRAVLLLSFTRKSIKEIGFNVGWIDPSSFDHSFRKVFGRSPTEFRAVLRSRSRT